MFKHFLIKGKGGQIRFGRVGAPTRKFEPREIPVTPIVSAEQATAQRLQAEATEKARIEQANALREVSKQEKSLKSRQQSLISEQQRLIDSGGGKGRINSIVRELLTIKLTLATIPQAIKSARAGASSSKISSFISSQEAFQSERISSQVTRTTSVKLPTRTKGLTDAEIIKQVEKNLGQSIPAATRRIVIEQARAGSTSLVIPTIREARERRTIARAGDIPSVIKEPEVSNIERITRSILPVFTGIPTGETRKPAGFKPVVRGLEFVRGKLDIATTEIRKVIIPSERREAKERKAIEVAREKLDAKFKAFDKEFGNRELTPAEARKANVEVQRLERERLQLKQRDEKLQEAVKAPTTLKEVPLEFVAGVATAVPQVASFSLGLLTDLEGAGEELTIDLPKDVLRDPFGTGAGLLGIAVGTAGLGLLRGARPKPKTRRDRIKAVEELTEFTNAELLGVLGKPPVVRIKKPKLEDLPEARRLASLRADLEASKVQRVKTATKGRIAALDFLREVERLEPRAKAVERAKSATREQQRIDRAVSKRFEEQSNLQSQVVKSATDLAGERAVKAGLAEKATFEAQARARTSIQARVTATEVVRQLGILEPRRLAAKRATKTARLEKQTFEDQARVRTSIQARVTAAEVGRRLGVLEPRRLASLRAKELTKAEKKRATKPREQFLTDSRTGTVLLLEKPKLVKPKPVVEIIAPTITDLQQATLKKLKRRPSVRSLDVVRPDAIVALQSLTEIKKKQMQSLSLRGELLQKALVESFRPRKKARQLELQLQIGSTISKSRQKLQEQRQKAQQKARIKQLTALTQGVKSEQGLKFAQAQSQAFRQSFQQPQRSRFNTKTLLAIREATSLRERTASKIAARSLTERLIRRPTPFTFPDFDKQFKKRQKKKKTSKKEEDLFFVQSFSGKVLGKKERATLSGFREKALNVNLASISGRPILVKRNKRKAVKKVKRTTTKKKKRKR